MPKGWRRLSAPAGTAASTSNPSKRIGSRALLGARRQLVGMTTQLSNHIRGILKVFGLVVGMAHGRSFSERVETLLADQPAVAGIVRPMLQVWPQLKDQIARFDKAVRQEVRQRAECRLLMSVPGVGALSVLAYVSAIEHPERFRQSRNVDLLQFSGERFCNYPASLSN